MKKWFWYGIGIVVILIGLAFVFVWPGCYGLAMGECKIKEVTDEEFDIEDCDLFDKDENPFNPPASEKAEKCIFGDPTVDDLNLMCERVNEDDEYINPEASYEAGDCVYDEDDSAETEEEEVGDVDCSEPEDAPECSEEPEEEEAEAETETEEEEAAFTGDDDGAGDDPDGVQYSWLPSGGRYSEYPETEEDLLALLDPGDDHKCTPYMVEHGCVDLAEVELDQAEDGAWFWKKDPKDTSDDDLWTIILCPDGAMCDGWVSNHYGPNPVKENELLSGDFRGFGGVDHCGRTMAELATWEQPSAHRYTGVPTGYPLPVQGFTIQVRETRYLQDFAHHLDDRAADCVELREVRMTNLLAATLED